VRSPTLLTVRETLRRFPDEGKCGWSGKVRYRTRKIALGALAVARKTGDWRGPYGSVYRCAEHCGSWHLSHLPSAVRHRGGMGPHRNGGHRMKVEP
jgi:hypothetical protein